jgi:hypothetical protein
MNLEIHPISLVCLGTQGVSLRREGRYIFDSELEVQYSFSSESDESIYELTYQIVGLDDYMYT